MDGGSGVRPAARERLALIEGRIAAGRRLDRDDALVLLGCGDLPLLGRLADSRRPSGGAAPVSFVMNRNLSLSDPDGGGAAPVERVLARATALPGDGLTELRLTGEPQPGVPWGHYPRLLRELRAALPAVRLRAFSATGLCRYALATRPDGTAAADELLDDLIDAGLDAFAGDGVLPDPPAAGGGRSPRDGAAEGRPVAWTDQVRVHRAAHHRGLGDCATLWYAPGDDPGHRVDHLLRLRALQDETGGFQVALALRHQHGGRGGAAAPVEVLRTYAASRLVLDNVPHLNAAWGTHGTAVAALALAFGADDLDAAAEGADHMRDPLSRTELVRLIREAEFQPVERDTRHGVLRAFDPPVPLSERRAVPQQVWD